MLTGPRNEIDRIDEQISRLLEQRYDAVTEVANIKKQHDLPVLHSNREQDVLNRVADRIENPDYEEAIVKTFKAIMDVSKEFQSEKNK